MEKNRIRLIHSGRNIRMTYQRQKEVLEMPNLIEVQKDSSGLAALQGDAELSASFGSMTEVADYNTALMDLESGACDAVCMDRIVAGYQIKSSGKDMKILDDTLSAEEYGIGFKKGEDELAKAVYDTLMEMKDDGTVAKISNDWFGSDVFTLK